MKLSRKFILLLISATLLFVGCTTTLPNVKPFAESTAELAAAAGTHYGEVSGDIESLEAVQLNSETDEAFEIRKQTLAAVQETFKETDKSLDALFSAMTTYSEKIASLAAAGKTGADAAQSILGSVQGFADLASISGSLGVAAEPIAKGFKAIADEFTKMEAKKSLKEAIDSAQDGVNLVAQQFEIIYGEAIKQASDGIRNIRRGEASASAGPHIIGFNDNVKRNYNDYYRVLNGFVTVNTPNDSAAIWRGFCRNSSGPCQAKDELEAVGLVEARMMAIRPIVESYEREIESIEATFRHRQKTSKAIIKAVKAWALEHEKLRRALEDGTSVSAFNLKAALLQLNNLFVQKP